MITEAFAGFVPLFAQESAITASTRSSALSNGGATMFMMLPILAFLAMILVGVVYMGLRHARYERELEHAERMRALEMGQTLPKDAPFWTPGNQAIALGLVLPVLCCAIALKASQEDAALIPVVWPMAGGIGVTGVICGTILALAPRTKRPEHEAQPTKPRVGDPDAYDTVGRRGWNEGLDPLPSSARHEA